MPFRLTKVLFRLNKAEWIVHASLSHILWQPHLSSVSVITTCTRTKYTSPACNIEICHTSESISMLHGRSSGSLDDIMLQDDTDLNKELDDFFGSEAEVSQQYLSMWWKTQVLKTWSCNKLRLNFYRIWSRCFIILNLSSSSLSTFPQKTSTGVINITSNSRGMNADREQTL